MLIPSVPEYMQHLATSLSRRVNANSQLQIIVHMDAPKLIKKGEC